MSRINDSRVLARLENCSASTPTDKIIDQHHHLRYPELIFGGVVERFKIRPITTAMASLAMTVVTVAMLGGPAAAATAAKPGGPAQASASGLAAAQKGDLQQRVNAVLAAIPGGRQVSATEVRYDGLVVTFRPQSASTTYIGNDPAYISCSPGWFCIVVQDTIFSFYACRWWDLTNWIGYSPYKNNQTTGTIFRAYDKNYNQVWSSTAYDDGYVNVTPWWHIKPC
jgi:hypothetical protein